MSKLTLNRDEWKLVGHFGVDAGLCWIGDPCYILHKDKPVYPGAEPEGLPESLGKDWGDFCDILNQGDDETSGPTLRSFNYAKGHEGLGVCVSTGFGDGVYPVYAHISEEGDWGKRVSAIFIDFLDALSDPDEGECTECGDDLDVNEICENVDCPECPDYEDPEICGACGEQFDGNGECVNEECIDYLGEK